MDLRILVHDFDKFNPPIDESNKASFQENPLKRKAEEEVLSPIVKTAKEILEISEDPLIGTSKEKSKLKGILKISKNPLFETTKWEKKLIGVRFNLNPQALQIKNTQNLHINKIAETVIESHTQLVDNNDIFAFLDSLLLSQQEIQQPIDVSIRIDDLGYYQFFIEKESKRISLHQFLDVMPYVCSTEIPPLSDGLNQSEYQYNKEFYTKAYNLIKNLSDMIFNHVRAIRVLDAYITTGQNGKEVWQILYDTNQEDVHKTIQKLGNDKSALPEELNKIQKTTLLSALNQATRVFRNKIRVLQNATLLFGIKNYIEIPKPHNSMFSNLFENILREFEPLLKIETTEIRNQTEEFFLRSKKFHPLFEDIFNSNDIPYHQTTTHLNLQTHPRLNYIEMTLNFLESEIEKTSDNRDKKYLLNLKNYFNQAMEAVVSYKKTKIEFFSQELGWSEIKNKQNNTKIALANLHGDFDAENPKKPKNLNRALSFLKQGLDDLSNKILTEDEDVCLEVLEVIGQTSDKIFQTGILATSKEYFDRILIPGIRLSLLLEKLIANIDSYVDNPNSDLITSENIIKIQIFVKKNFPDHNKFIDNLITLTLLKNSSNEEFEKLKLEFIKAFNKFAEELPVDKAKFFITILNYNETPVQDDLDFLEQCNARCKTYETNTELMILDLTGIISSIDKKKNENEQLELQNFAKANMEVIED